MIQKNSIEDKKVRVKIVSMGFGFIPRSVEGFSCIACKERLPAKEFGPGIQAIYRTDIVEVDEEHDPTKYQNNGTTHARVLVRPQSLLGTTVDYWQKVFLCELTNL